MEFEVLHRFHETQEQGHWAAHLVAESRNAAYEHKGEAGHQEHQIYSSHLYLYERADEVQAALFAAGLLPFYHPLKASEATVRWRR